MLTLVKGSGVGSRHLGNKLLEISHRLIFSHHLPLQRN